MDLSKELELAKKAALDAGQAIAEYYGKTLDISYKMEDHPLTEADLAANRIIRATLGKPFPDYSWLSEEDVDNEERLDGNRLWVIDPLDGTKDFINKNPEFAVSIALVEDKKPILGVVYNPVTKELFHAVQGQGAFCQDKPIQVRKEKTKPKTHLLASMSEYKKGEWTEFENQFQVTATGGCAYKMSKVARGDADGTFTLNPKSEWDICAGHVIVEEAGGKVSYLDGETVTYNNASTLIDGLIYTSGDEVHAEILEITRYR